MSEHEIAQDVATATAPRRASSLLNASPPRHRASEVEEESAAARWLEKGDTFIYALVGACFFLGALFTKIEARMPPGFNRGMKGLLSPLPRSLQQERARNPRRSSCVLLLSCCGHCW
jgi:hypothetical protein